MLVHCLLYVPTISITDSIAFANMKNPEKEFGIVRMGGTIGWILAAWPFTFIFVNWAAVDAAHPAGLVDWLGKALANPLTGDAAKAATKWTYIVAGLASLLLAAFSLTLPRTAKKPALAAGAADNLAWLSALKLLKQPFILVLWLVTLVDSFVHNCYFSWTGTFLGTAKEAGGVGIAANWIAPIMSIGQVAEILTMFVLGATLKKFGLAHHDGRRRARPRGAFCDLCFHARKRHCHHSDPSAPRHLLRVLLRDRAYLRRCLLPEGHSLERAGPLQSPDPRRRSFAGVLDLPMAHAGSLHQVRHRRL